MTDPGPAQAGPPRTDQLHRWRRTERTMVIVRAAAVPFGLLQVLTFYRPYPPGTLVWPLLLLLVMAVANLAIWLWMRRVTDLRAARRLGVTALALDAALVLAFVFAYTFDPDTAVWALLYLIPLEGAIRFQLTGALATMAVATVGYALRDVYGTIAHGNEFLLTSVSFRMGIGFLIATVAGVMASNLVRERDELAEAKAAIESYAAELAAANVELQRAARMRDDFLAMTNHELRTPLTAIVGYASTLSARWDEVPDDRRREFTESIRHQATRLQGLVEDLLMLSSLQAGALVPKVESVEVASAVEEAIGTVGAAREVENACPPGVKVRADPQRLSQILTNYVSNAVKYGSAPVTVEAAVDGGTVDIRVRDSGPGVPEEFAPRLFDKFSRATDRSTKAVNGTGLGLAIVRLLAEAQSGQAWYEPDPAGGSVFCVRLPAEPADPASVGDPAGQGQASS